MSGWNNISPDSGEDQEEISLENLEEDGPDLDEVDDEIQNLLSQLDDTVEDDTSLEAESEVEAEADEDEDEEEEAESELSESESEEDEVEPQEEEDEEETSGFSERANKRIRQLANERRLAEQRAAEAEAKLAEIEKKNKEALKTATDSQLEAIDKTIENLVKARRAAQESGDMEAFDKADEDLMEARISKRVLQAQLEKFEKEPEKSETVVQEKPKTQESLPKATRDFIAKNETHLRDPAVYSVVMGISQAMTAEGADWEDPTTYKELEKKLAAVYPDKFKATPDKPKKKAEKVSKPKKSTPKVGTSSPSVSSKAKRKKVTLTAQERLIAEEMGISEKEYLAEKIKLLAAEKKVQDIGGMPWINLG